VDLGHEANLDSFDELGKSIRGQRRQPP
jgi:hypothetical protein